MASRVSGTRQLQLTGDRPECGHGLLVEDLDGHVVGARVQVGGNSGGDRLRVTVYARDLSSVGSDFARDLAPPSFAPSAFAARPALRRAQSA